MSADTPVTDAAGPASTSGSSSNTPRIAAAATLIAVLTVAARVVGFGRTVVFAESVGFGRLGDVYVAANIIPNVVFEIVAGGALAGLVVPLLAGPLAVGDRDTVNRTVSALLTWSLSVLIPLAVLVAVLADPIMSLLGPKLGPQQHTAGVDMLRVFAPQVPLYGVGIVLAGVLQAHRRFAWPVLAPLLSSITVIGTYLIFAASAGVVPALAEVTQSELMILAGGTTLGVLVLSLCLLLPVRSLGLRVRWSYQLRAEQRRAVGGLALAGTAVVAAQQIAVVVAIRLALAASEGSMAAYNVAWTVFLLPWAVLAVPLATAAYPSIATAHVTADQQALRRTVARTGRAVALASSLGAAGLVALAWPGASLLTVHQPGQRVALAHALIAFAPGLLGYGLTALHQRTLYAVGAHRAAAVAIGAGWAVTVPSAVLLSYLLPAGERAAALAAANSIGMTVMAVILALAVRRRSGAEALNGLFRSAAIGTVAAVAGAGAALAVWAGLEVPDPGVPTLLGQGMLSGGVAALMFAAVGALLAPAQLRPLWQRIVRSARRGSGGAADEAMPPDGSSPPGATDVSGTEQGGRAEGNVNR